MAKTSPRSNLHVPLPTETYDELRAESERVKEPTTVLARRAIEAWLAKRQRERIDEEIAAYVDACAGSREDLDPELEATAVEHLISAAPPSRRRR